MHLPCGQSANHLEELGTVLADTSGPVAPQQIDAAERELGVAFPESYRAFLRLYGAGRLEWLDIFGLPQDRLWGDVVVMNQLAPVKPPANRIWIARDPRGAFYAMETSRGGAGRVWRMNAESIDTLEAESFIGLLQKVLDDGMVLS